MKTASQHPQAARWHEHPLGEVCEIRRGATITRKTVRAGEVPVVAGGIGPAYFHDTSNRPANIITVSGSGANAGYVNFYDRPIWASDCSTILPKSEGLDVRFVYKFLLSQQDYINENLREGAAQPHVYPRDLAKLTISLPPIEEQRRIVAVLDQAFAALDRARALAEANLADAEGLLALATDALCKNARSNWVTGKMGDYCAFEGGFAFKSGDAVDRSDVQIVRIGNLYKNVLDLDRNPAFYPSEFSTRYARFKLSLGDIIMSLTGTVGKQDYGFAVEVPNTERALLLNQRVARITPKDRKVLSSQFLLRFLRSGDFLSRLYQISRGTRQANLSTKDIADLEMTMPPLRDQLEIVEQLEVIEAQTASLRQAYLSQADDLSDLRQSLLQTAFAGELT